MITRLEKIAEMLGTEGGKLILMLILMGMGFTFRTFGAQKEGDQIIHDTFVAFIAIMRPKSD